MTDLSRFKEFQQLPVEAVVKIRELMHDANQKGLLTSLEDLRWAYSRDYALGKEWNANDFLHYLDTTIENMKGIQRGTYRAVDPEEA